MEVGSQSATTVKARTTPELELHMGRGWATSENALVKFIRYDSNGYYRTLGLLPNATRDEIKAAFRRLVKIFHPDLGGDEELYRFIVEIAKTLLNPTTKKLYDSVGKDAFYIGDMEREELARIGVAVDEEETQNHANEVVQKQHWACLTTSGFLPGDDTDAWIDYCRQVSPAVGYRGKVQVGVIESGHYWPCDSAIPWGILTTGSQILVIFQRGVEPNRLHALCAMIDWQKHLPHPSN